MHMFGALGARLEHNSGCVRHDEMMNAPSRADPGGMGEGFDELRVFAIKILFGTPFALRQDEEIRKPEAP